MKVIRGVTELLSDGRREEQAGRLKEAATWYEAVMDRAPGNSETVRRLLVIYRRLKNYTKELVVIDRALNAYAQRGKAAEEQWIVATRKRPGSGKPFCGRWGERGPRGLGPTRRLSN